jgi:hypothetical protein
VRRRTQEEKEEEMKMEICTDCYEETRVIVEVIEESVHTILSRVVVKRDCNNIIRTLLDQQRD